MKIKASGRSALMVAAGIWIWCAGPLQAQEASDAAMTQPAAQQATQPNPLQQLFGVKPTQPAAPATEQTPAEPGKPVALNTYRKTSSRHSRRSRASRAARHSRKAENRSAAKSSTKTKTETTAEAGTDGRVAAADNATPVLSSKTTAAPLSASVANARAQLLDTSPAADTAAPLTSAPASIADRSSPAPATLNDGSPLQQSGNAAAPEASGSEAEAKTEAGAETRNEARVVSSDELNDVDRALAAQTSAAPTLALATVNTSGGSLTTGQAAAASDDNSTWTQASLIGKIFIAFGGLLTLASAVRMLIA